MPELRVARSELILGGQKSGKSRRAEQLADLWVGASSTHRAVMIATAQVHDDEMRLRVARHQRERAQRVTGMVTVEESTDLPTAIARAGGAETLRVVDCLTLWLTSLMMPLNSECCSDEAVQEKVNQLLHAIEASPGPIVLVGNEIGLGVIPMGREVRRFVDALGVLNQSVASKCERVCLMAAGLPLLLKGEL